MTITHLKRVTCPVCHKRVELTLAFAVPSIRVHTTETGKQCAGSLQAAEGETK